MAHMKKPERVKYDCYQEPLDTWATRIEAARCIEEHYWQIQMILKRGGRLSITWKRWSPKRHKNFVHRRGRSRRYFVIVNASKECTRWIAPRSQNYVVYSEEETAKLCKLIKMGDINLPSE